MPVRGKGKKVRYVAFRVDAALSRKVVQSAAEHAAKAAGLPPPQLTSYEDGIGFLRTTNAHAPALVEALSAASPEVSFETLTTSGTLKAARSRVLPATARPVRAK